MDKGFAISFFPHCVNWQLWLVYYYREGHFYYLYGGVLAVALGSINTGLPKDIVQQIIAAEKIPIKNMEEQKEKFNDKIKLFDELIGMMRALRGKLFQNKGTQSFRELKSSFRDDLVNVVADKNIANAGSYQFEVLSLAQKSSVISNGLESPDDIYLGVGYLSYQLPDGTKRDIFIDSDHATLNGVAKLINADDDNKMMANVINDGSDSDTPWRLLIALEETGDGNRAHFPRVLFC